MGNLLYGFESDMSKYSMREVFFYLLFFSVCIYASGKNMEKDAILRRYFHLIRYTKYAVWWRGVCLRIFWRNIFLTGAFTAFCWLCSGSVIYMPDAFYAVCLWLFGLFTLNLIQLLLAGGRYGMKILFPVVMAVEVLSVYGEAFGKNVVPFLPGSLLMFRRSSLFAGSGFTWRWVIFLQLLLDMCIVLFGYRVYRRRMV